LKREYDRIPLLIFSVITQVLVVLVPGTQHKEIAAHLLKLQLDIGNMQINFMFVYSHNAATRARDAWILVYHKKSYHYCKTESQNAAEKFF
jgi:hypothetical protein